MDKMGRSSSSFTTINITRSSHFPLFAAASFLFLPILIICSSSGSSPFTAAAAVLEEDPCSSNYALASAPPSMLPPRKLEAYSSTATDVLINPHDQPPQLPAAARQQRRVPKAQMLPLKQGASQSSQLLLDFGRQQPSSCLYDMTFKTSCYSPTPDINVYFALDIRDVLKNDVVTFLVNPNKYPCAISTRRMTGRCPRHPLYYLRIRSNGLDGWVLKYVSFRVTGTIFDKPVFFCIGEPLPPTSRWFISNCCQYGGDRAGNRCDNHQDEGGEE